MTGLTLQRQINAASRLRTPEGTLYGLRSGPTPSAARGGGNGPTAATLDYPDISKLFREALAGLTGDTEKMYQQGKRRTLSDIAMQSVNAGMANTLNLPAASVAYDEANRPTTNLMLGQAKAGILQNLGQVAAGMYGQNLGAQTALQTAGIGAATSRTNALTAAKVNYAQLALQKYLAELGRSSGLALNESDDWNPSW